VERTVPRIEFVQGDITRQSVDAIVNAANSTLLGGGGVDGAIHRAGGPEILVECRDLRTARYPEGLPTGEAVATTAGRLDATWVIHTVGPVYAKSIDKSHLLASCYRESLALAADLGAASIAFPAISTGVYAYPLAEAARIAVGTVLGADSAPALVRFVLFSPPALAEFETAFRELSGSGADAF
jgi:O-acetyl-ADP-ribose deacetylase (regulator of RNase III)